MKKVYRATADCWNSGFTAYYSSLETALKLIPINAEFRRVVDWDRPRERKLEDGTIMCPIYSGSLDIILSLYPNNENAYRVTLANYQWKLVKTTHHPEVKDVGKPYVPAEYTTEELGLVSRDEVIITTLYIEEITLDEEASNAKT